MIKVERGEMWNARETYNKEASPKSAFLEMRHLNEYLRDSSDQPNSREECAIQWEGIVSWRESRYKSQHRTLKTERDIVTRALQMKTGTGWGSENVQGSGLYSNLTESHWRGLKQRTKIKN